MKGNEPATFEEVDQLVQAADLRPFQAGGRHYTTRELVAANPAAALANVCAIYKVVRPILELAANSFLLPKKWREAIRTVMSILDTLCP